MEKKLTAQGPKDRHSFTITLPIEWIKKNGLDKKKIVNLEIVSEKVVVSAGKVDMDSIVLDGKVLCYSMIKVLQSLYRCGINEIRLNFSDYDVALKAIDVIERKTIGYEIISQSKNHLLIRDITKESEEDFKIIFRRIYLLILELSKSTNVREVDMLNKNIDKLINYCQRILIKKGHIEFEKIPLYYLMLDRLEKICDEYKWLLRLAVNNDKDDSHKKYLDEINEIFRVSYEIFYKFDGVDFNKYQEDAYLLKNKIKDELKVSRKTVHLHNLSRILNSLYGDIFALKYDKTVSFDKD